MAINKVSLRPLKLVSTKTLLLKHYYRRQGTTATNFGEISYRAQKVWQRDSMAMFVPKFG